MKSKVMALVACAALAVCVVVLPLASPLRQRGAWQRQRQSHKETSLLSLRSTGTWQEFFQKKSSSPQRTDKSVLVGAITLKNKNAQLLDNLIARWQGNHLGTLSASLYAKKNEHDPLIPIEENLICDGQWNPRTQEFIFPVNKKLVAIDTYYLVLSFPRSAESTVKQGHFAIQKDHHISLLPIS